MSELILILILMGVGVASIGGSAYLLKLWHEDAAERKAKKLPVSWRTWPFSRVLAYVGIASMLSSNTLGAVSMLRLAGVESFRAMQTALSPLTVTAVIFLDAAFVIIALYLRLIRRKKRRDAEPGTPVATGQEAGVDEAP